MLTTSVKTAWGNIKNFWIGIGQQQWDSDLNPYLFYLILNVITRDIQRIITDCISFYKLHLF